MFRGILREQFGGLVEALVRGHPAAAFGPPQQQGTREQADFPQEARVDNQAHHPRD